MIQEPAAADALQQILRFMQLLAVVAGLCAAGFTALVAMLVLRLQKFFAARPVGAEEQVPSRAEMQATLKELEADTRTWVHTMINSSEVNALQRHSQLVQQLQDIKAIGERALDRAEGARDKAHEAIATAAQAKDGLMAERELRASEVRRLEVIR